MTDDLTDPARAFDDLRREVSLLVRAIQGLAAEHRDTPDYSETLKAMDGRLLAMCQAVAIISKSPAMGLTLESMAERVSAASIVARRSDAELLSKASQRMNELSVQLGTKIEQAHTAGDQRVWLVRTGGACFFAGIVITVLFMRLFA